jgi:hypothetical protein
VAHWVDTGVVMYDANNVRGSYHGYLHNGTYTSSLHEPEPPPRTGAICGASVTWLSSKPTFRCTTFGGSWYPILPILGNRILCWPFVDPTRRCRWRSHPGVALCRSRRFFIPAGLFL